MNRQSNEPPQQFETAFRELLAWCRGHKFAGYDPFDGLNSRLFQATALAKSRPARLAWIQLVKRSPLNLRPLIRVPPQRNAKGIALFALAALANYRRLRTTEAESEARELLDALMEMRIGGLSGVAAWGYNFEWQSRNFFAPHGSPTVVATAFAARALIEAARVFQDEKYLNMAGNVCEFIVRDLPVKQDEDGAACFSYSPRSETRIFNASLLAAETLAEVSALTGRRELCGWAQRATRYVIKHQREDGSWTYGVETHQSWIDNFHSAFILYSLGKIIRACHLNDKSEVALQRGYEYWREHFFLADGWPKYYDDTPYPADAHSAASAIVTLLEFRSFDPDALNMAERVAGWAINNLRDRSGYFYYQRRRFFTVRTPFMRWTQAWMLYALGRLLEEVSTAPR